MGAGRHGMRYSVNNAKTGCIQHAEIASVVGVVHGLESDARIAAGLVRKKTGAREEACRSIVSVVHQRNNFSVPDPHKVMLDILKACVTAKFTAERFE